MVGPFLPFTGSNGPLLFHLLNLIYLGCHKYLLLKSLMLSGLHPYFTCVVFVLLPFLPSKWDSP